MAGTDDERDSGPIDDDDRVRSELAHLGDQSSAPDVPPEVTARVVSALRAAPPVGDSAAGPKHTATEHRPFNRRVAAVAGLLAAVVTVGLGTFMVLREPVTTSKPAEPERIRSITVSVAPAIPLSDSELVGLLSRPADLGALADASRRASCLTGLGYPPAAPVLAAQQIDVNGPAIRLVLAGGGPDDLAVMVVRPECSAAHSALIAQTQVRRP